MKRGEHLLTQDVVNDLLAYDPETGFFTRTRTFYNKPAGSRPGYVDGDGYRRIQVRGVNVAEHRLAWFVMTGKWPPELVDHRNYVKDDNRWENLRLASKVQNGIHRSGVNSSKKSGLPRCVFFALADKSKYRAVVATKGRHRHLGVFVTVDEAVAARDKYEQTHAVRNGWQGAHI